MSEMNPEFNPKVDELSEIQDLPEKLGFLTTEKLKDIKQKAAVLLNKYPDSVNMNEKVVNIMTEYQLAGEEILSSKNNIELTKAQIGLMIDRALLLQENGWHDDFRNELNDAILCAHNEKMDDLVKVIKGYQEGR